jgi:hypothetical protein
MNKEQMKQMAQAQAMAAQMQGGGGGGGGGDPYAAMMAAQSGGDTAAEIMASAMQGNQMAWSQFSSKPNLYTDDPEAVHKYLGDLVQGAGGPMGANLLFTVSRSHPEALVPHTAGLLKYCSDPQMGPILIQALKNVAIVDPDNIYPFIPQIIPFSRGQLGAFIISQMVGAASNATVPADAAANMFVQFVGMLKNKPDATGVTGMLSEVSNMKVRNCTFTSIFYIYYDINVFFLAVTYMYSTGKTPT